MYRSQCMYKGEVKMLSALVVILVINVCWLVIWSTYVYIVYKKYKALYYIVYKKYKALYNDEVVHNKRLFELSLRSNIGNVAILFGLILHDVDEEQYNSVRNKLNINDDALLFLFNTFDTNNDMVCDENINSRLNMLIDCIRGRCEYEQNKMNIVGDIVHINGKEYACITYDNNCQ